MAGADHAIHFWRDVVSDYTVSQFVEDIYQDQVTRQRFSHATVAPSPELMEA